MKIIQNIFMGLMAIKVYKFWDNKIVHLLKKLILISFLDIT